MKLIEGDREVEVSEQQLPVLADLLIKWGYDPLSKEINVSNINNITCELSAWGIPWKRTKWSY